MLIISSSLVSLMALIAHLNTQIYTFDYYNGYVHGFFHVNVRRIVSHPMMVI